MNLSKSPSKKLLKSVPGIILLVLFAIVIVWRAILFFYASRFANLDYYIQVWGVSYQIIALLGVICGLFYSKRWGGWRSVIGRANILFALGLCGQLFGQSVSSFYTFTGNVLPYPSIADIGFFITIPMYAYGAWLLAKAGGAEVSLQSFLNKVQAVLIPVIILAISSVVFLNGYVFDWTQPLKTFLDFGYPLGDAIYISMGILAFSLSWRFLGGVMRAPIFSFIIALILQYIADFTFLYQNNAGTFVVGGIVDIWYMLAYFVMALSLIQLGVVFKQIQNSPQTPETP